jgi:hypothetical protein
MAQLAAGMLMFSATSLATLDCCCCCRVPEGSVDVVLSYCHNSLHDTSLLEVRGRDSAGHMHKMMYYIFSEERDGANMNSAWDTSST